MQRHFITFADRRLRKSLSRIKNQAAQIGVFDTINAFTEEDLPNWHLEKFSSVLKPEVRGFGYWTWKPVIIKQFMSSVANGDCLLYVDVGCHINQHGRRRLVQYFELLDQSTTGVIAFQSNPPNSSNSTLKHDGRRLFDQFNYEWVKGDLFDFFDARRDKAFTHSQAIGSGVILIKKCTQSMHIVSEWERIACDNYSLIDDSPSASSNLDGFIENRHDQALFTLLCIKYGVVTISAYEYWYPKITNKTNLKPDWPALKEFPVHAKRDKKLDSYTKINILSNKIKTRIKTFFSPNY